MTTSTPRRAAQLAEKTLLGVIAAGALAVGATSLVMLIVRVSEILSGSATTVSIPLMAAPAEPVLAASQVTEATYDSVSLTLSSVPEQARGMLVTSDLLAGLVPIGVCAMLVWLCVRVFLGRPFVRSATWGIGLVAVLVVAGGLGGAAGRAVAHSQIADALDLAGSGLPMLLAEVPLAPLGWGVALAVVGAAFEIGQRMQRETEGLV